MVSLQLPAKMVSVVGVTAMTTATDFGQNAPNRRIVTVLGGTGFLGHRVVLHLLKHGFSVRIISRHPEQALSLLKPDQTGVEVARADVHDETSVAEALAGAFGAVNAVSLYVERGDRETFHAVHVDAAARIARLAREAGVRRLVHVSGIGADSAASSDYIRARGEGEVVVR